VSSRGKSIHSGCPNSLPMKLRYDSPPSDIVISRTCGGEHSLLTMAHFDSLHAGKWAVLLALLRPGTFARAV